MGITGLLPFLKKASTPVHIREFSGYTVAIDTYCWLHKSSYACAMDLALGNPTDQYVRYALKYIELLFACNIKPILVFDGTNLPSKSATERKRRESKEAYRKKAAEFLLKGDRASAQECFQRSVFVTPKMANDVLLAARNLGVDCIVAPYEADAQLAYLNRAGYADLIITEDSDLLLFGCRQVLFKFDLSGSAVLVALSAGIGELCCGMRPSQFTDNTLRFMGIIAGCDYFSGIPGIGLATAAKILRQTRISDFRELLEKLGLYTNLTPAALSATIIDRQSMEVKPDPELLSAARSNSKTAKRDLTKRLQPSLVDAAVRAERTFRLQVVFDPSARCQRRLSDPTPEDIADELRMAGEDEEGLDKENLFSFAGRIEPDKSKALQLALGNLDFHTGELIGSFDPDRIQNLPRLESQKRRSESNLLDHFKQKHTSPLSSPRQILGELGRKSATSFDSLSRPDKKRLKTSIWDKCFQTQKVWIHRQSDANGNTHSVYCLTVGSNTVTEDEQASVVRNAATILTEQSQISALTPRSNIREKSTFGKQVFVASSLRENLHRRFGRKSRDTQSPDQSSGRVPDREVSSGEDEIDSKILEGYKPANPVHDTTPAVCLKDRFLLSSTVRSTSKYFSSAEDDVACALGVALDSNMSVQSTRSPVFNRNPFRIDSPQRSPSPVQDKSSPPFWREEDDGAIEQLDKFLDPESPLAEISSNPSNPSVCGATQPSTPPVHSQQDDSFNSEVSPNFLSSHVTRNCRSPGTLQSSSSIQRFAESPYNRPVKLDTFKRKMMDSSPCGTRKRTRGDSRPGANGDLRSYFTKWRFQHDK